LILATFAMNGPARCSGLDVCRYDPPSLAAELGEGFTLTESYPVNWWLLKRGIKEPM